MLSLFTDTRAGPLWFGLLPSHGPGQPPTGLGREGLGGADGGTKPVFRSDLCTQHRSGIGPRTGCGAGAGPEPVRRPKAEGALVASRSGLKKRKRGGAQAPILAPILEPATRRPRSGSAPPRTFPSPGR